LSLGVWFTADQATKHAWFKSHYATRIRMFGVTNTSALFAAVAALAGSWNAVSTIGPG